MAPRGTTIKSCNLVYPPAEDSDLLAESVERLAFGKVLDIGTGTGIQGIVAAKKGCKVVFCDIDENAIKCAKRNCELNGVIGEFVTSDIFKSIRGRFNTLIFNPPYLPTDGEKRLPAYLDGGADGRRCINRFLAEYKDHVLREHVVLLLESSLNGYVKDIAAYGAEVVGRTHISFEDIVVLRLP